MPYHQMDVPSSSVCARPRIFSPFVPRHLFDSLLAQVKPLDSFYEWEIPKYLLSDLRLPHLTILPLYLFISRGLTNGAVLVTLKLFPKQKAAFWTAIYS